MKKTLCLALAAVFFALSFSACGGELKETDYLGTWYAENGGAVTFTNDGRALGIDAFYDYYTVMKEDREIICGNGEYIFKINSDDTLTCALDDDDIITFYRDEAKAEEAELKKNAEYSN